MSFRSPRALAVRILAVVLALATARTVATDISTLRRRTAALGPLITAVIARTDLDLGTRIDAGDLTTVERHESQVAPDTLTDPADAVGRTLLVPLVANAALQQRALADPDAAADALITVGSRGVRVVTDDGLRPRVGSAVDVLAVIDPSLGGAGTDATVVARGARVLGVDEENDDAGASAATAVGVVIRVTEPEARQIAFATASGVLMLALAPPEDACCDDTPG